MKKHIGQPFFAVEVFHGETMLKGLCEIVQRGLYSKRGNSLILSTVVDLLQRATRRGSSLSQKQVSFTIQKRKYQHPCVIVSIVYATGLNEAVSVALNYGNNIMVYTMPDWRRLGFARLAYSTLITKFPAAMNSVPVFGVTTHSPLKKIGMVYDVRHGRSTGLSLRGAKNRLALADRIRNRINLNVLIDPSNTSSTDAHLTYSDIAQQAQAIKYATRIDISLDNLNPTQEKHPDIKLDSH